MNNEHGHVCAQANLAVCAYVIGTAHANLHAWLYVCKSENKTVCVYEYVDVSEMMILR